MKKVLICVLAVLIAVSLLAACGNKNGPASPSQNGADSLSAKTVGEAFALAGNGARSSASYEGVYVCVLEIDGTYWRLTAELTREQYDALIALDIFDEDHEEKELALISPLAITKCENLSELKLSDGELAALAGKTGAELLNGGWVPGMGYNLDSMEFYWEYGPFEYTVTFEAAGQLENTDDFDVEAAVSDLKVVSVEYCGLGSSCTDLPE